MDDGYYSATNFIQGELRIPGESQTTRALSGIMCFGVKLFKKQDTLPVSSEPQCREVDFYIIVTRPSAEPDREAMKWARDARATVNGKTCSSGLTIPLPARKVFTSVKQLKHVPLLPTPVLRGIDGDDVPELDLNSPNV